MISKERVKKAILFQGPDKIPTDFWVPWPSDFYWMEPKPDPKFSPKVAGEDEFGCIWEKLLGDTTIGQVKYHPLNDYSKMDKIQFPNYKKPERYEHIKPVVEKNLNDKFILVCTQFSLIHRLEYLRGHEQAWTDPYLYPEELERLLDRLTDIGIDMIDNLAKIGVDGFFTCDDWGLQDRLMLPPEVFRQFFKPRYKRIYQHAKRKGIFTFLHSCGYTIQIMKDFIEAGLNVLQLDQQENMGVENIDKEVGGKICFWCPVDIQQTMIHGSVEDIQKYARRLIDVFGKYNGGFMSRMYPNPDACQHSKEKIEVMSKAFVEYGDKFYKK
jgi:uroporphyrinogen decarboxylase